MNEETTGGYLIPETYYQDVKRAGVLFSLLRWSGGRILRLGAWLRSLGYSQKETHPHADLMEMLKRQAQKE